MWVLMSTPNDILLPSALRSLNPNLNNHFSVIGIVGGASVQEYIDDDIKKHEQTLTLREEVFTQYLDQVGFNAEPVLMTYDPQEGLNELIQKVSSERPEYEFTTTDRIKHELWILSSDQTKKCQN